MVNQKQVGFTLLETLVALSVLAIILGVVYQIFGTSLRNMQYTKEYSYAQMYAESKLSELGKGIPIKEGNYEGSFDQKYTWKLNLAPFPSVTEKDVISKFRINFIVLWDSSRGQRSIKITTHRLSVGGL
jgi:general secretion pathway protein I